MEEARGVSRRRLLAGVGLGVAGAALAACGATPTPQVVEKEVTKIIEGTPQVVKETVVVQETVVVEVTAAQKQVELAAAELAMWIWWPDPVESLKQMSKSFTEAHPEVKISVEAPTDYWTKLQTALAGGAGPDLYFVSSDMYAPFASKGVLLDLDPFVSADPAMLDNLRNSWNTAVEVYSYKGKNYGLPYMYTTVVLYYNEDYVKQEALTPVADIEDSFDWNSFREYGLKLTKREGDKTTMWGAMSTGDYETSWLDFVRGNHGDFFNQDGTKCIIDQEPAVETFEFLANMRLVDKVSPSPEVLQAEDTRSLFMTGKLALWPGGSWVMKTLNEQLKDFEYNIAILPKSPHTGDRGGVTNIVGAVINKDTKSKEQSAALLTHILRRESQDMLAKADVLAPVRNDSAELYYDPALGPSNRRAAFKMQQWMTNCPTTEKVTWEEWYKPVGEWELEIFEGRVSPEEGLTNMAADVNKILAQAS